MNHPSKDVWPVVGLKDETQIGCGNMHVQGMVEAMGSGESTQVSMKNIKRRKKDETRNHQRTEQKIRRAKKNKKD